MKPIQYISSFMFLLLLSDECLAQKSIPHVVAKDKSVDVYQPANDDEVDSLNYLLSYEMKIYNPQFKEFEIRQIRTNRNWKFDTPFSIPAKDTLTIVFNTSEYKHYKDFKIFDDIFIVDLKGGGSLNDRHSFLIIGSACEKEHSDEGTIIFVQKDQNGLPAQKLYLNEESHPIEMGKELGDGSKIGSWRYWDQEGVSNTELHSSIAQMVTLDKGGDVSDFEIQAYVGDSLYTPVLISPKKQTQYCYYSFDPMTTRLLMATDKLIAEQRFYQEWKEFEMVVMTFGSKSNGYAYHQNQRIFFEDTLSYLIKSNLISDGRQNVQMAIAREFESMGLEFSNVNLASDFYHVDMKNMSTEKRKEIYKKLDSSSMVDDWGLSYEQAGNDNLLMLSRDFYIYSSGDTQHDVIQKMIQQEEALSSLGENQHGGIKYIHLEYKGHVNIDYLSYLNKLIEKYDWILSYQLNFAGIQERLEIE